MTRHVALHDVPAFDLRRLDDVLNGRVRPVSPTPANGERGTSAPGFWVTQSDGIAFLGPWGPWRGI